MKLLGVVYDFFLIRKKNFVSCVCKSYELMKLLIS